MTIRLDGAYDSAMRLALLNDTARLLQIDSDRLSVTEPYELIARSAGEIHVEITITPPAADDGQQGSGGRGHAKSAAQAAVELLSYGAGHLSYQLLLPISDVQLVTTGEGSAPATGWLHAAGDHKLAVAGVLGGVALAVWLRARGRAHRGFARATGRWQVLDDGPWRRLFTPRNGPYMRKDEDEHRHGCVGAGSSQGRQGEDLSSTDSDDVATERSPTVRTTDRY